jgi:hypothetical protein
MGLCGAPALIPSIVLTNPSSATPCTTTTSIPTPVLTYNIAPSSTIPYVTTGPPPQACPTCNPTAGLNFCDVTTSCIETPSGSDYCACRAGYRADSLSPTNPQQFRLDFPDYGYLVFVAPGVSCNTLCTTPFPGPDSCQEVSVQSYY